MPNYSRKELLKTTSTMNQLRNMLYHLIKYLGNSGKQSQYIKKSLRKMGQNIGKTEASLFNFDNQHPDQLIKTMYDEILGSKVTVSKIIDSEVYTIENKKCCVCKYHRKDIAVAPCEIIHSMISELLKIYGYKVEESIVEESIALGSLSCVHSYKFKNLRDGD